MQFEDLYNGRTEYRVLAVADGREGMPSPPVPCLAGEADHDRVRVLSISAPTRAEAGKSVDFSAILLDNTSAEYLTAFLYWRIPGRDIWNCLQMERREKSIFGIRLPGKNVSTGGLEYYIKGSDGKNEGVFPVTAPELSRYLVVESGTSRNLPVPKGRQIQGGIAWEAVEGNIQWYRIYRGRSADFEIGPQSYLTYVSGDSCMFRDIEPLLRKEKGQGEWFYKVTAVDINLGESHASTAMKQAQCLRFYPFAMAEQLDGGLIAANGKSVAMIRNKACLVFSNMEMNGANSITIIYSAKNAQKGSRIEIWTDGSEEEVCIRSGMASFPSTGSWEQLDTVTVPIRQQEGSHTLYFVCKGGEEYLFNLIGFIIGKTDIIIRAEADSFAVGPARPSIRLTANDTVKWTVKTLEGKNPDWAQVSRDGIFSAWGEGLVRVTAVSEDGKRYGERVIVCGVIR